MNSKRSSGLDFQDRAPASGYPDSAYIVQDDGPAYLHRNRRERGRLQTLMNPRLQRNVSQSNDSKRHTLTGKWDHWMVNDGSRHIFFAVWILLQILVVTFGFVTYELSDNLVSARAGFGVTYSIARTAALVLHVDAALILIPVCRNFISLLRRTRLNQIVPFDQSVTFHKAVAWSMVFWTFVHVAAHMANFVKLAKADPKANTGTGVAVAFLKANFLTGPGITGWIMTGSLAIMVIFAFERQRRLHFERFWYSHHLFIPLFVSWQLHGMFCMMRPDRPPFCSWNTFGVFWRFWLVGGVIFVYERILREVRSRHRTYISKVIQHPSNVMEIQIKKEKTATRAGQYIFLSCPEISYFQWHPFTLTSAPEEDYLSVHVRVVGDFTSALARSLGCDFDNPAAASEKNGAKAGGDATLNKVLPRVMIDGPFGSASESFLNYETVLLIGAGLGILPFASILKSIWYRLNNFNNAKRTRLSKVYFIWVIRDFSSVEWFHSLLHALEEQEMQNRIEMSIYLTAKMQEDESTNIIVQDVGAATDAITSLRAPTHFGRPNWDRIFASTANQHPDTDVGVFFCGPPALSRVLHEKCNKYTDPRGTRFFISRDKFEF